MIPLLTPGHGDGASRRYGDADDYAAIQAWAERRAKDEGRPACPTCGRRRYVNPGPPLWCRRCDEPAVG